MLERPPKGRHHSRAGGPGAATVIFARRLGRQFELELVEEQLQLGFGLGEAGERQLAPVGGRQVYVDHRHGGELLEHAARGQPRRQGL